MSYPPPGYPGGYPPGYGYPQPAYGHPHPPPGCALLGVSLALLSFVSLPGTTRARDIRVARVIRAVTRAIRVARATRVAIRAIRQAKDTRVVIRAIRVARDTRAGTRATRADTRAIKEARATKARSIDHVDHEIASHVLQRIVAASFILCIKSSNNKRFS